MRTYPCDSVRSGWSAILKARTLIQISWPNETERAFSEEAPSTTIRPVAETVKLKQKYLFQRRDYWTLKFCRRCHQTQALSFRTNIVELDFWGKNCLYHKCRLLISNLQILVRDSCPRPGELCLSQGHITFKAKWGGVRLLPGKTRQTPTGQRILQKISIWSTVRKKKNEH